MSKQIGNVPIKSAYVSGGAGTPDMVRVYVSREQCAELQAALAALSVERARLDIALKRANGPFGAFLTGVIYVHEAAIKHTQTSAKKLKQKARYEEMKRATKMRDHQLSEYPSANEAVRPEAGTKRQPRELTPEVETRVKTFRKKMRR